MKPWSRAPSATWCSRSAELILDEIAASVSNGALCVTLRHAPPLALHGAEMPRTDGNSPVLGDAGGSTVFFSHYSPRGHSYRRDGSADLHFTGDPVAVRFVDDADPETGKWIEAVWPDPATDGTGLYGLFHAEVPAPCERPLFLPEIRIARSADRGLTWRSCGTLLRDRPAAGQQRHLCGRSGALLHGRLIGLDDRFRARRGAPRDRRPAAAADQGDVRGNVRPPA